MTAKALPVIPSDRRDDLHGLEIAEKADLVLFMAGNQFMVMPEIVSAFQAQYPEIKNIFYETLPPGLALKQILAKGAIFQDKVLNVYPDIYSSVNYEAMKLLEKEGHTKQQDCHLYLHNRLTLMVPRSNPTKITSVRDLGRSDVRISQPDPENEDIAYHIMDMTPKGRDEDGRVHEQVLEEAGRGGRVAGGVRRVHHQGVQQEGAVDLRRWGTASAWEPALSGGCKSFRRWSSIHAG